MGGVLGYTQDGSDGASDGDGNGPDHRGTESDTICSSRERERERGVESARHRGNWDQRDTSNGGPTTDRWGGEISPLVDVDSPKVYRMGRKKPYRVSANPKIAGTYLDYWMWLCRPNIHDAEPKPVPSIQTPK